MLLLIPGVVAAQDSVAHENCRDPHPAPVCRNYMLFEYMAGGRMVGTQVTTSRETRDALRTWFAWDVGWMQNTSPSTSRGGSLGIGGSADGTRITFKAKQRWWLDHNLVFDASAGPLVTAFQRGGLEGQVMSLGATADVGVGRARLGLLTVSADAAQQGGRTQFAVHGGVRTESRGVVIVSAAAILGAVALIVAIGASCNGGCNDYNY